ncbi:MAG: ISAs1 family transposase [Chloroflexi bacterium]|nr:ISAs1 family transposase [Chloroflexota bacterium]
MEEKPAPSITSYFSSLEDPRSDHTRRHKLIDIVTIAICGVICGADSWVDLEIFGKSKVGWLKGFLELPGGIPSHDTFGRVFSLLDSQQFRDCFSAWVQAVSALNQGQVIAIDGKTVRRSHDKSLGRSAIHMVSAWASENRLVLGQTKVAEKSNEITAIPELLALLDVSGCIVTTDAMGCQKEIASLIIEDSGDYVLALKENQGQLYQEVKELFEDEDLVAQVGDFHQTVNKGHGRLERRRCWGIADRECLSFLNSSGAWRGLRSVAKVTGERRIGGKVSIESRYFISSLPGDAKQLLWAVREHWGIENSLHWVLDIAFREDESRVRKGHGPENLATMRHMALNMIRRETSSKGGVKARRLRAGWDEDYLLKVLSL